MLEWLRHLAGPLGDGLALASATYVFGRVWATARRLRSAVATRSTMPTVSISVLKPLHGAEPEQYLNLRSFFEQDGVDYQLVFGVADAQDPALAVVEQLRHEFPQRDVAVVIDSRRHGHNPKVSNLINLFAAARHELLVIADADIRAPRHYLTQLARELSVPDVGIVTCLYYGLPQPNLWSRLGSLFIDDWFAPSVRVAHALGARNYAFGATIALRRQVLAAIGGFEVLADRLADDWWLGELVRRQGLKTVLSQCEVGTLVNEHSVAAMLDHGRRWMRTIRAVQLAGYMGLLVTFTLPTALLGACLGGPTATAAAAIALVARAAAYWQVLALSGRTHERRSVAAWLLLPAHDLLMVWMWLRGFSSQRLRWGDQALVVDRNGLVDAAVE